MPDRPIITLKVQTPDGCQQFMVPAGTSVRDALDTTELRVRAACGGSGSCGACTVILIQGEVGLPGVAECMHLRPEERAAGTRLACQLRLHGDSEIRIDDPAPPSQWKSIAPENLLTLNHVRPDLTKHPYGVAVDLGTTHIRLSLWDRKRGKRIATRRGPNPQGSFGADVLNRLAAAQENPERRELLAKLARSAIVQALRDILKRDVGEVTPMLAEIGEVLIVGNSAMLALLTGTGIEALLDPDHWSRRTACQPADAIAFQSQWFMPHAAIVLPEPVAGFIGSDLLADLLTTRLIEGPPGSLLLDIGTNTEIALWDGARLHVTAVPGGPAFEGVGLRNGMAAEPGAICRVRRPASREAVRPEAARRGCADFCPNGDSCCEMETIAGSPPRGFCGSGLIDAVAFLRASGNLKPSGRFTQPTGPDGLLLDPADPHTALFGHDIDAIQRAKAATAAAMETLLVRAGMRWQDLSRLCVCGAFGHTLDVTHAQAIGLLPPLDPARIELFADASLAGCEIALLQADGARHFAALTDLIDAVNLSFIPGYDDCYISHLRIRPIHAT